MRRVFYQFIILLTLAQWCVEAYTGEQAPMAVHEPFSDDMYELEWPIRRVAIIGAGLSGMRAYQEFVNAGFDVRMFERDNAPGGNWHYTDEIPENAPIPNAGRSMGDYVPSFPPDGASLPYHEVYNFTTTPNYHDIRRLHRAPKSIYESLTASGPSPLQEIPEFPWPQGTTWELSHWKLQNYLRSFASLNGINSNDDNTKIEYDARVENVAKHPTGKGWTLTIKKLTVVGEETVRATWWTENFDAVVVATGRYNAPNVPNIPGLIEWHKRHPKSISHSRAYRRPYDFINKTVLIVGASTSGSEISRDINPVAKKIYQSIRPINASGPRDPLRIINMSRIPKNTTIVGEIVRFHPPSQQTWQDGGLQDAKIELTDGSIITGIDHIIFATGFHYTFPFLPQYHKDNSTSEEQLNPIVTDGTHLRSLYLDLFYIDDPTLGFLCMPIGIQAFILSRYQAATLAKVWDGKAKLPSQKRMWELYFQRLAEKGGYSKWFQYWGWEAMKERMRFLVAWLNDGAMRYGGTMIDLPPEPNNDIALVWILSRAGVDAFDHNALASINQAAASGALFVDS